MAVSEEQSPTPVYLKREPSNIYVSTVLSAGQAASGSAIPVQDLTRITAFVNRGISANALELQVSPDGTNFYQWKNFPAGAIPAAGEKASMEEFVSGATVSYVKVVLGTWSSGIGVVRLNALTK